MEHKCVLVGLVIGILKMVERYDFIIQEDGMTITIDD